MQFQAFDRAYLEKLRAGDFRTQEHFVAYFSELIRLKLGKRLKSRSDVEDARQETFVRFFAALRKEDGIQQPERLGAYVNSVCNNVLLEYYRSSSQDAAAEDKPETDIPDSAVSALDLIANREMQQKVHDILGELEEKERRLIREVFLEERDKDEVCRALGVNREYLRVLLCRAKKSFKSLYIKKMAAGATPE